MVSGTDSALARFVDGLRSHRPAVVLSGLGLGVGLLLAIELALALGALWRLPVGYLLSGPLDDWSHASWLVGRLAHGIDRAEPPPVLLIGGSSAREAVDGSATMSDALGAALGAPRRFVNLGIRNHTHAEGLLLAEQLPAVRSGMVVFSVHPVFLCDGPDNWRAAAEGVRMPFRSPTLAASLATHAPDIPTSHPVNVMRFRATVANWLHHRTTIGALLTPLAYQDHLYQNAAPMDDAQLEELHERLSQDVVRYREFRDANLELLSRAMTLVGDKGYDVVLVELPRNPVTDEAVFAPVLDDYRTAVRALASRHGAPLLALHDELGFVREDFFDHIHFLYPARPRFERSFVDRIAAIAGPS